MILFFNKVGFSKTDGSEFTNEAMQHLRYNYKFSKKFSTELFLQNQYNAISKIEYRRLIGAGIRWKISPSEKFKVYLGNLIMFESEKSKEQIPIYNQDWRNSTYLSYTLLFTENAKLISTSYIQPKFIQIKDYRFSHQTSLSLKLLKNLSFSTNFFYAFNSNPVDGIPKKEYELTNGISYSF